MQGANASVPKNKYLYILPNLVTTINIATGFYAIISAIQGNFYYAAIAMIASILLDGLDGTIAIVTHTQSRFGAEYDSFADLIAFGIAPAIFVYMWIFAESNHFIWVVPLCYCIAAAFRLARFNVTDKQNFFSGVPCGVTTVLIATIFLMCQQYNITISHADFPAAIFILFLSLLMVIKVKFYSSNKGAQSAKKRTLLILTGVLLLFFSVKYNHFEVLLGVVLIYMLLPIINLFRKNK